MCAAVTDAGRRASESDDLIPRKMNKFHSDVQCCDHDATASFIRCSMKTLSDTSSVRTRPLLFMVSPVMWVTLGFSLAIRNRAWLLPWSHTM